MKGPKINNSKMTFTTRDNLGIEGVATSISRVINPIVNTVTKRAFYWAFLTWIYYDYYKNYNHSKNHNDFYYFLKRQDYFFVLSNVLLSKIEDVDLESVDGKSACQELINKEVNKDLFEFNKNYVAARLGGMNYFNAGLLSMKLIIDKNPETEEPYRLAKLTQHGKELAISFENIIKETEYYKNYRLNEKEVPKRVLLDYAKVINIGLIGFDETKMILKKHLIENKRNVLLKQSSNYLIYLNTLYLNDIPDDLLLRKIFFDYFSKKGEYQYILPEEFRNTATSWEIVIARQYFTVGLQAIWKYMLEELSLGPLNKFQWINKVINDSNLSKYPKTTLLKDVLINANFNNHTREDMISKCRSNSNVHTLNLIYGLEIMLSIYNRMHNCEPLDVMQKDFFNYGKRNSISFNEWFDIVDKYKNKPYIDLLFYIMSDLLIEKHYKTAFEKMLQGRDGFYYEKTENLYIFRYNIDFNFQGIRARQLYRVIRDLDMLGSDHNERI